MQIMKYYIIIHNTSILIYTLPIGCASCTLRWLSWQYFGIEMFPCIATFRVASSADRAGGYAVEARTWQHLCCPWARYVSALMCSVPCLSNTAYPCEKIKVYDIVYHNQNTIKYFQAPPQTQMIHWHWVGYHRFYSTKSKLPYLLISCFSFRTLIAGNAGVLCPGLHFPWQRVELQGQMVGPRTRKLRERCLKCSEMYRSNVTLQAQEQIPLQ